MKEAEICAQTYLCFSSRKGEEDRRPGVRVISFDFHFSRKRVVTLH